MSQSGHERWPILAEAVSAMGPSRHTPAQPQPCLDRRYFFRMPVLMFLSCWRPHLPLAYCTSVEILRPDQER